MEKPIYSKEYSVQMMLDSAWKIFTRNFAAIAAVTLLTSVPLYLAMGSVFLSMDLKDAQTIAAVVILFMLTFLFGLLSNVAIAFMVKADIDGEPITLATAIRKALSRWPYAAMTSIILFTYLFSPLVVLMVLFYLILKGGISSVAVILLLGIGALILLVFWLGFATKYCILWSFSMNVSALGNKTNNAALDHSKEMVRGRWWKVFGIMFFYGMISGGVSYVLGIPLNLLGYVLIQPIALMTVGLVFSSLQSIADSFFTVLYVVFYLNYEANRQQPKMPVDEKLGFGIKQ